MVKTLPSKPGDSSLIPVQGTKIPHAMQCGHKNRKKAGKLILQIIRIYHKLKKIKYCDIGKG